MRISRDLGLVFLANPKCASTTVERYIDIYTDHEAVAPSGYPRHMDARILEGYMAEEGLRHDDFFIFTSIRNPWDRIVSLWSYAKKRPDSVWYEAAIAAETFHDFLHSDIVKVDFVAKFGLDGFTHTGEGRRLVDDVLCVESYAEALPLMFGRVGIEFVGSGLRVNPSDRDEYQSYYSGVDRDLVGDLFAADIRYGKYVF